MDGWMDGWMNGWVEEPSQTEAFANQSMLPYTPSLPGPDSLQPSCLYPVPTCMCMLAWAGQILRYQVVNK